MGVLNHPIKAVNDVMKSNINPIEYTQLFSATSMPYLIGDFFLKYYKPLQVLEIFSNKFWAVYIPKEIYAKCLNKGLRLYGDQKEFIKYKNQYADYRKQASRIFQDIVKKEHLGRQDIIDFFKQAAENWKYYQKTEFFYVDQAYLEAKNNNIIKENLKEYENIKFVGRKFVNKMIFEQGNYLSKLLEILEKQFQVNSQDLLAYSKQEIKDLFVHKKVGKARINARKKAYVFSYGIQTIALEGFQAANFIKNFLAGNEKRTNQIKGVVANPGKAVGEVKFINQGFDDFAEIKKQINKMKQGDILVADTTSPELMFACKKAAAIITNQGGLMSHAAIVSRELSIPCVVGTKIATQVLKDGMEVEVDAENGVVKILNNS